MCTHIYLYLYAHVHTPWEHFLNSTDTENSLTMKGGQKTYFLSTLNQEYFGS